MSLCGFRPEPSARFGPIWHSVFDTYRQLGIQMGQEPLHRRLREQLLAGTSSKISKTCRSSTFRVASPLRQERTNRQKGQSVGLKLIAAPHSVSSSGSDGLQKVCSLIYVCIFVEWCNIFMILPALLIAHQGC